MSSDTLRGIGQEGDGEGEEASKANGTDPRGDQNSAEGDSTGGQLKLSEALEDCVRSLDSTVPRTLSLDSRVPDETPSPEAKVPNFAATLLGVPAPTVSRDRGTVQGRDVHLPPEAQRSAGLRPIAGDHRDLAAPVLVEQSEPTQADPVVGAAVARASSNNDAPADSAGQAPWYDQMPPADEVTDDRRPDILARVAIGAALAAILSIFIFGFVRLRARNSTAEEAPVSQGAPEQTTVETPTGTEQPTPTVAVPSLPPSLAPEVPVASTSGGAMVDTRRPPPIAAPSAHSVDSVAGSPLPKLRAPAVRPSPGALAAHGNASRAGGESDSVGGSPSNAPSTTRGTSAEPATALVVRPPVTDVVPATAPTVRSAPSDKPKSKPAYDPDSTLPLNLE